jgi:hypothetical protein
MRIHQFFTALVISVLISACTAESPSMFENDFAALPDWNGVWMGTGTLFDQSSVETNPNTNRSAGFSALSPRLGGSNARDFPPYRPDWETAYEEFLERVVRQGRFSDPLSLGYPPGMLRNMNMPYGIQIVVRPEMVWIIHEGPHVRYIYTDGRPFPPADELWPTFEGYSIGHWEGDTLVVETASIKGGIPVDRTGLVFSDKLRVTERMRKISETVFENQMTIEDPIALTGPWNVRRVYNKREDEYPRMENVPVFENQRNPIVNGVTTTLLADEIDDSSSPYPPEVRALSLPNIPTP